MKTAVMPLVVLLLGVSTVTAADLGVYVIDSPPDTTVLDTEIAPQVWIYSDEDSSVTVQLRTKGSSYCESIEDVDIQADETLLVDFPDWTPESVGVYVAQCSLVVADCPRFVGHFLKRHWPVSRSRLG